jgi:hypothetical protein
MPQELHVLRSDRMSVVPGTDGWPVAYEYAVGRQVPGLGEIFFVFSSVAKEERFEFDFSSLDLTNE